MLKWLLVIPVLLSGCYSQGATEPDISAVKTVVLTEDFTFTHHVSNTRYVITQPITVDMAGFTLTTYGVYDAFAVRTSNVTIKNGTVKGSGFATGVKVGSCLARSDIENLELYGESFESTIYQRCLGNTTLSNLHLTGLRTGVYVGEYTKATTLRDSKITQSDRMAVYLSPSTTRNVITGNTFTNNGYRDVEGSGRQRGTLSCDGCVHNLIEGNTIQNTKGIKKSSGLPFISDSYLIPELEFYRNCGEETFNSGKALPRIQGADFNTLSRNTFRNVGLAIHFQYREQDQLSSCLPPGYADKSDYNTVTDSTLVNVGVYVIDGGVGNLF